MLEQIIKPKSRDRFARAVLKAMRRENPGAKAEYRSADFSITRTPGGTIFLSNAYDEYCRSPVLKRGQVIAFYAALKPPGETIVPKEFSEAVGSLLPRVRERFSLEAIRFMSMSDGQGPDVAHELLNEHLTVELVYDTPQSMALVPRKALAEWGVSFAEALGAARDNLWKISNENWIQPMPGLHVAPWRDFHTASRLFLHDLVWQLPVKGSHVAMIPNRNCLFVAGDQDDAALLGMAKLVESQFTEPRFMTAMAFRLRENRWEEFIPPPGSAAHGVFREFRIKSVGQHYAEQKRLLEEHFKKRGDADPPFVASFTGSRSPQGSTITIASWAEGVETLLPDADCFALGRLKGQKHEHLGFIDRVAAFGSFADLLERTEDYPARWKTKGFPTPERLAGVTLHQNPPMTRVAPPPTAAT